MNLRQFVETIKPIVDEVYTTNKNIVNSIFYQPGVTTGKWDFNKLNEEGKKILEELIDKYKLPKEIIYLYLGAATADEDLKLQGLTLISLKTIKKNCNEHIQYGQNYFVDLGMKYAGMGYCYILAWNVEEQKFFFRMDGGSNYFDVEYNYRRYIKSKKKIIFKNKIRNYAK
jgi:hypothetical protein